MYGFEECAAVVEVVCVDVGLVVLLTEETSSTVAKVVDCPVIENKKHPHKGSDSDEFVTLVVIV